MADKFLDTARYTYAATPTWGTAQEGDGTAIEAATPATVSVNMSTWTFTSGSSTFSIMGSTAITIGAGANSATNAQFSAVYATMLANMVAAINLATAVNHANIPAGWVGAGLQTRARVFARVNGSNLEIMTRAGSASWNGLVAVSFANVTGSSSQSWGGGAGGAWGWLYNVATIWPSAIAIGGYGLWCAVQPQAGVQAAGDNVFIRANNQTLTNPSGVFPTIPAVGTTASPITHYIDSGNKWSGDPATATFSFATNHSGGFPLTLPFNTANLRIVGKKIGEKLWNLKFNAASSGANGLSIQTGGKSQIRGFNMTSTGGGALFVGFGSTSDAAGPGVSDFTMDSAQTSTPFLGCTGGAANYPFEVRSGTLRNTGAAVVHTGALALSVSTVYGEIYDLVCEGFVVGSNLTTSVAASSKITLVDCDFGGITARGPYFGIGASVALGGFVAAYSTRGNRESWLDNQRGMVEWNPNISQPNLRATLLDGTTKWSWKILPLRAGTFINWTSPMSTLRAVKLNTLATGARTFTAEFCVSDTLSWTKREVSMIVRYRNAAGEVITLNTYDPNGGALSASSQTWNQESAGKVTFSQGGTLFHNKYLLSISTPAGENLPLDGEVEFTFNVNAAVANTTQLIFVDPDLGIA